MYGGYVGKKRKRKMKRGEKSREGPAEKQENLGEKLRRGVLVVGKRGGQHTPVLPPWRLLLPPPAGGGGGGGDAQDSSFIEVPPPPPCLVSARKLAATLWELHHYRFPLSKMHHGVPVPPPRLRRLHHHHHQHKGLDLTDPSPSSPDLPGSASGLRRHVAASLMQHHRSIERNNHAIQPVSPSSCGSSMEVAPYNPAVTPTSSLGLKGRIGETSYSLKTSTELLKVLNRIWSLEEQHTSNVLLVKALKKELDHARVKIKELVRDQQADRHEIEDLRNQISEDKLVRKSREHDRISAAIQSARDELEDERKLRKRSEGLHKKLARELYEVKTSLANALKELERERKSRKLLEDLCDEFALGIRDFEQEVHVLKQKTDKDWVDRANCDRLFLHISESWLDERMQTHGGEEKNSIAEKLSSEIENFLQARRNGHSKSNDNLVQKGSNFRRSSLESIPLNAVVSAPRDVGDDEDSAGSDSHCFELNKPSSGGLKPREGDPEENNTYDRAKPNHMNINLISHERAQPVEASISMKSEICEVPEEGNFRGKKIGDGNYGSKSNYIINDLLNSQYLLSEARNMHPDNSLWRRHASPVRQWTATLPSQDVEISESSSKLPPELKENTLKEKLLEARAKGQRSRSRLKSSKVPF